MTHERTVTTADGWRLPVRISGSGSPMVLLHGFPDDSSLWDLVVPSLVDAGWRVVAPDLRGFGRSEGPLPSTGHSVQAAAADVAAVAEACDAVGAPIVGHDWGGLVAWHVAGAGRVPVPWLVSVASPHPDAFAGSSIEQRRRSWYVFLFNLPLAAPALRRDDWALFREWAAEGGMPPEVIESRVAALGADGALDRALDWYRDNLPIPGAGAIAGPALVVHAADDPYVLESVVHASTAHVSGVCETTTVPTGHWVPLTAPDALTALITDFADRVGSTATGRTS